MATQCYVLHNDAWLKTQGANSLSAARDSKSASNSERCSEHCLERSRAIASIFSMLYSWPRVRERYWRYLSKH
eukprot:2059708-Amphidinium_carterae.1